MLQIPPFNIATRVRQHCWNQPEHFALWSQGETWSYSTLGIKIKHWQQHLLQQGLAKGDQLVLLAPFSAELVAVIQAAWGLGIVIVVIEPWQSVASIQGVMERFPRATLLCSVMGGFWYHLWVRRRRPVILLKSMPHRGDIFTECVDLTEDAPATITFSSGTFGSYKGVRRSHQFIARQIELLSENGKRDAFAEPDLAFFAGVAILHALDGRGAILVGRDWSIQRLRSIVQATSHLQPATVSVGPYALQQLLATEERFSFKHMYVGGALLDRQIGELVLTQNPQAMVTHIYGTSEAEPLAITDLRQAILWAKEHDEWQLRLVGEPFGGLEWQIHKDVLHVRGPQVCTDLIVPHATNSPHPLQCIDQAMWLRVDDRIEVDERGLIFAGRHDQPPGLLREEQRLYSILGHTRAFLHPVGEHYLVVGEDLKSTASKLQQKYSFPIAGTFETPLCWDRRHRARLARRETLRPSQTWRRWTRYINERSPPLVLAILALGPVLGGRRTSGAPWWMAALFFVQILLAYIVARLMDERKDFQKDLVLHPTRPLPRGLLTVVEVQSAIDVLMALQLVVAGIFAWQGAFASATAMLILVLWMSLMDREFYCGKWLQRHPWIQMFSHQTMVLPLYFIPFSAMGYTALTHSSVCGFLLLNQAGSWLFEIARKLDPAAPRLQQTYLVICGLRQTMVMMFGIACLAMIGVILTGTNFWLLSCYVLIILFLPTLKFRPKKYKLLEVIVTLASLLSLWTFAMS